MINKDYELPSLIYFYPGEIFLKKVQDRPRNDQQHMLLEM